MKKVMILLIFFSAFVLGSTTTIIKSGWQLVGLNSDIDDMTIFQSDKVDQVWVYDATSQKWSGYSPNSETLSKIQASHGVVSKIGRWQGIWIKSSKEWYLVQEAQSKSENAIDTIELKKGWNLISIPLDSVLSPKIFDDNQTTIWKYNSQNWQLFDQNATGFESIESIKSSDGIWLKAQNDRSIDISKQSALLQTFDSKEAMKSYIESLTKVNYYPVYYDVGMPMDDVMNTTAPTTSTETSSDAKQASDSTTTNLQEDGVDESNTIKNDGTYVYYLNRNANAIEIRSFSGLVSSTKELVNKIDLSDNYKSIDSFYLYKNSLVVLSNSYQKVSQMVVDVYDISTVSNISKSESFTFDASLISSRILDNKLIVVSNFTPYAEFTYPKLYLDGADECKNGYGGGISTSSSPDSETSEIIYSSHCYSIYFDGDGKAFRYDYDNPSISNQYLIPQLSYSKFSRDLIDHTSFYAPKKQNQSPTITTLSTFDLDSLEFVKSSSIVGDSSIVYASTNALYTISQQYPIFFNYNDYQERSVIYKFDIANDLGFEAMGFINGRALNQFSLSEYNNVLRVASTEGFSWSGGETKNSIFTLKQNGYDLDVVGYLGSLGKEGETIRSVRFIGTKGFVVTFLQTDPLYTLDLSDPSNPSKVGELAINGFSQYMHFVDNDRLLTIGRDANSQGVQQGILIELFDISDFANPKLASKLSLGDSSYSSEALSNHKAFIYRQSDELFGFDYNSWNNYTTNYFGAYQVDGLYLNEVEKLSIYNQNSYNCNPRGVIFDYNSTSYLSYFCSDSVVTKALTNIK